MNKILSGSVISLGLAAAFTAQANQISTDDSATKTVMCGGINACKGQSACATANNACKGLNTCKGQGWLPTASEKECLDKGGKVISPPVAK